MEGARAQDASSATAQLPFRDTIPRARSITKTSGLSRSHRQRGGAGSSESGIIESMKYLFWILPFAIVASAAEVAPYKHGAGWMPLLNGRDLSGWRARESKPSEWFTTTAVEWTAAEPEKL